MLDLEKILQAFDPFRSAEVEGNARNLMLNFPLPISPNSVIMGIPFRRDLIVSTSTMGGYSVGNVVPRVEDVLAFDNELDQLGVQIAGAEYFNKIYKGANTSIAVYSTGCTFAAVNENAAPGEGQPVFSQVASTPKQLSGWFDISLRLWRGVADPENFVRHGIRQSKLLMAQHFYQGTGAPQMTGILNTSGIATSTGTSLAYSTVLGAVNSLLVAGVDAKNVKFVADPIAANILRTRTLGTGGAYPIASGTKIFDWPLITSPRMPASTILVGDFSYSELITWGGGWIVIIDPYTGGAAGTVRVTVHVFVDTVVKQPSAFAKIVSVS